jgi:hypothetical protein
MNEWKKKNVIIWVFLFQDGGVQMEWPDLTATSPLSL